MQHFSGRRKNVAKFPGFLFGLEDGFYGSMVQMHEIKKDQIFGGYHIHKLGNNVLTEEQ